MAFEPFLQILRGLQGRRTNAGIEGVQNAQQMAFLRNLQKEIKQNVLNIPLENLKVVVFDIETTGFSPDNGDVIISIGAIKMVGENIIEEESFYSLVQANREIPEEIVRLTGITDEQVKNALPIHDVFINFLQFSKDSTLVAHHASHERNFMEHTSSTLFRTPFKYRIIDTTFLIKVIDPHLKFNALEDLCLYNDIPVINRHHALEDAKMTAKLWSVYVNKAKKAGCETLNDVYHRFAIIK